MSTDFVSRDKINTDIEKVYLRIIDSTIESCKSFQNSRIMDALKSRWISALSSRIIQHRGNSQSNSKFLSYDDPWETQPTSSLEYGNQKKRLKSTHSDTNPNHDLFQNNASTTEPTSFPETNFNSRTPSDINNNPDNSEKSSEISKFNDSKECTKASTSEVERPNDGDDEFSDADVDEDKPLACDMKKSEDINSFKNHESCDQDESRPHGKFQSNLNSESNVMDDIGEVTDLSEEGLSELDDDEPQTDDFIVARFDKIKRPSSRKHGSNVIWKVDLRAGIMQLDGQEIIFDKLTGEFAFN